MTDRAPNQTSRQTAHDAAGTDVIRLRGVRQHNLRGIDLDIPLGQITCITGVSGSGKSSLAFDTLYAEGQRRYVECLSSYARQFLERMDRPDADEITGILPTVALEQGKRLRAARSTVATLTETSEYLKVVFATAALPTCPNGHGPMARLRTNEVVDALLAHGIGRKALITFPLEIVGGGVRGGRELVRRELARAGLHRRWDGERVVELGELRPRERVDVVIDRLRISEDEADRLFESVHEALRRGDGEVDIWLDGAPLASETGLHAAEGGRLTRHRANAALRCDTCGHETPEPAPNLFSWNSPVGACDTCNGFGRIMALDEGRCIPDEGLTLAEGAIKPWSTARTTWEREQLEAFCAAADIDLHTPWRELSAATRTWLLDGFDPERDTAWPGAPRFYGLREWFAWLETRTYRMHVRVLLSRYRKFVTCPACDGARLKPAALGWRLAGHTLPEWLAAPVDALRGWISGLKASDEAERRATSRALIELGERVGLLHELGLGYVTLGRPGRTLSGGELQRVQLVTALSSQLSQVLIVLDEPSVGLHPRDTTRLLGILQRLKAAGNTVVLVEHDPELMAAADLLVDLGPGAGEHGGGLCYVGPPSALHTATGSLTADYLLGRRHVDEAASEDATAGAADGARQVRGAQSAAAQSKAARGIAKRARNLTRARTQSAKQQPWLAVVNPRARNLQGGRPRFRRGRLNVVCGVSGSGKSTLVEEVLYRAMLRKLGRATDAPGAFDRLDGFDEFTDVVLIEQAAVAGNSRANPATYLKLWDGVRKRLAATPLAKERGYTASTFSFNRPGGRCPVCDGAGLEVVDMQFISDVRITCEACEGRRFRPEVLDVQVRGHSAADLLAATAAEVAARFADDRVLARPAKAMCELGLGYLRLGQPLSTLSGGESQRLKVAWHLLCQGTKRALFLLDEPSTGLHLDDVRVLLGSLRRLVAAGNTVIVVEHHLDVIAAADHLVELGPEGGPEGGQIVYQGPPARLAQQADSAPTATATGRWLRRHADTLQGVAERDLPYFAGDPRGSDAASAVGGDERLVDPGHVEVRGARVHNLRDVAVDLPRDGLTVVTGLSGSGKSSLAFDVVFAEGQRRFLDCLSPYARQYLPPVSRPDVDSLRGLPATIAIAQRTTRGGTRSTVGTLTDIQSYLRLLFARCGRVASDHTGALSQRTPAEVAAALTDLPTDAPLYVMAPVVRGRKGFHLDVIDKAARAGRSWIHVDGALCPVGAVPPLRRYVAHDIDDVVVVLTPSADTTAARASGAAGTGAADTGAADTGAAGAAATNWRADALEAAITAAMAAGDGQVRVRSAASAVRSFDVSATADRDAQTTRPAAGLDPLLFSFTSARGWCPDCRGSGLADATLTPATGQRGGRKKAGTSADQRAKKGRSTETTSKAKAGTKGRAEAAQAALEEAELREGEQEERRRLERCPTCHGARLRPEALAVTVGGATIAELSALGPQALLDLLEAITWSPRDAVVAEPIVEEVAARCRFLLEVGLDYLGLDRSAVTLSGGESQRIRLASQLSSNLRGVLYVLDEPTIGLHAADNQRLLAAFDRLRARGNGLLVVEHDEDTIRRATHVVELGPGGGESGGALLHAGSLSALLADPDSPTGRMLADPSLRRARHTPREVGPAQPRVTLRGARRNNLQRVTASVLRGRLNGVSGVSGSGKSTLIRDLLVGVGGAVVHGDLEADASALPPLQQVDAIDGLDGLGRVVEVDQQPIGRTPRSCPATYLGVWDHIRKQFASQPEAQVLGLKAKHFSFNVKGGRCEDCQGAGVIKVDMSFLPTVYVPCETCAGARYNRQTLRVHLRGATIADVLAMSVAEAAAHFQHSRAIHRALALAERVGLGYLRLGQGSNTLSGGEAQRMKICAELAKQRRRETLYVLDEPSTGLHLADQRKLLDVLHDLVDRGDTVVVIEHNLDVLREADWLIDLGPGGGVRGGTLCFEGPVVELLAPSDGAAPLMTPTAVALRGEG